MNDGTHTFFISGQVETCAVRDLENRYVAVFLKQDTQTFADFEAGSDVADIEWLATWQWAH